jgi:3',5'-nucleoside bisphosphate phosphatase
MDSNYDKDFVDLHTHSKSSDGKYSSKELIQIAKNKNLRAIALTDHDTIAGIKEFINHGKKENIETIPGVEIEVHEKKLGFSEVHIVGLFINYKNSKLKQLLQDSSKQRTLQKEKMINKISELGFDIKISDVKNIAGKEIGRPHIAKVLIEKNPGKFNSISDVFDKLLIKGKPGFVEREEVIDFKQAIDAIHSSGGLAFFAHPFFFENWENILNKFIKCGGDGVETFVSYPEKLNQHINSKWRLELKKIIKKKGLLESGGTDFHGTKEWEKELGSLNIPYSLVEKMKNRLVEK